MATLLNTKERRAWQVLHSALEKYLLPSLPAKVVLAISGGPDSRALLEAIARWPYRLRGEWLVACIDHSVRPQASKEAQLVAARAQVLGFASVVKKLELSAKENEQSLREKRYGVLCTIAQGFDAKLICCAHHRDDNAEGYLMSLLGLGGGASGAAMAATEPMGRGYHIFRPFLEINKNQLLMALSLSGYTDFVIDNLDQERAGKRAYVRHEIIPNLASHAPYVTSRLDLFAREERFKKNALKELVLALISWSDNEACLDLKKPAHPHMLALAIRTVLKKWSSHLDLRQCRPTIDKVVEHATAGLNSVNPDGLGLDRSSKWFIVRALETKTYQLPGAVVRVNSKEIVIRRV